jgi:hypothetical protein
MRKTREYRIWMAMKRRCQNPNEKFYPKYGGVGIKVCDRWQSFENFFADMGAAPTDKHELDRYPDRSGNYEPGNVRWATRTENNRNRCSSVLLTFRGRTQHLVDWAKELGVHHQKISKRLKRGWPVEKALS